jgi:plastocyanin
MRVLLAVGVGIILLAAAACSSSSTAPANSCGSSSAAANVGATDGLVFSPNHTAITHGQSVCWQNNGTTLHTVTDDGGAFNTQLPTGQVFIHIYPAAGTFPYHCTLHSQMTGTITVN